MKKVVLKLDLYDGKDKRKALKTVSTLSGIDEISIDVKGKKLTVIGTVDPVSVVSKLRKKNWPTDIISVGPAKEPEKKAEPKKEEPKKEEPKKVETKEEPKKEEAKKEGVKKEEKKPELVVGPVMPYKPYYPAMNRYYYVHHRMEQNPNYVHHSMEENPNSCIIC